MPVIATIIIETGLTKLAVTAASPNINAPIIPIVGPIGLGILRPASRINSKEISISKTSITTGNGTLFLEPAIVNRSSVGTSSVWKLRIAIYSPGKSRVITAAKRRIIFNRFAY